MITKNINYTSIEVPYGWTNFSLCPEDLGAKTLSGMLDILDDEIVPWLYNNIKDCEKNAQWFCIATVHVHIRRKKDAVLFALRWA